MKKLSRKIENSLELRVAAKYQELDELLGKLRNETMKYSYVDSKTGGFKITDDPRLADLQQQIQAEDSKLQKVRVLADQMGEILDNRHADSIHSLQERRAMQADIVRTKPYEAWALFKQFRGEGETRPEDIRVHWLPSDLAQIPEYRAQENEIRSLIEAARTELVVIDDSLQNLFSLAAEARGL